MSIEALRAALEVLEGLNEDFVCSAAHHAAKDYHFALAPCPINERRLKAIELIRAALAQPSTERKPLHGYELAKVVADAGAPELNAISASAVLSLIRAIERAHGIGEKE